MIDVMIADLKRSRECGREQLTKTGRKQMATKVWRKGEELVHDGCFEESEDRALAGYSPESLDNLDSDDMCAVCSGEFVMGPDTDDDDDEDDEDDD